MEQDKALFAAAVAVLKEQLDQGERLPLYYCLPTGRSIESLCDRVLHLPDEIPCDLLPPLHSLASTLAIPEPKTTSYRAYAQVLQEIAVRLSLPFDQTRRQKPVHSPALATG